MGREEQRNVKKDIREGGEKEDKGWRERRGEKEERMCKK